jgi:ATP-dependent Clp endopeptidase proteolytic subunit ClpP
MLLNDRIVYLGMPLVPAVTELIIAQIIHLMYENPDEPIYLYVNSTGTTRDDGEIVGLESEGFAVYDALMQLKCEIRTVGLGHAIGHACLLLAAGTKGKRSMLPHARAVLQQPRMPPSGMIPASEVLLRSREALVNRDTLIKLVARHTGHTEAHIAKVMSRPYFMTSVEAQAFGVVDKILWRGQEDTMRESAPPESWDTTYEVYG